MSEKINFLVRLRRSLAFDHCYDFYHMKEAFEKPLELIKFYLKLESISIQGHDEEDIQQEYEVGKIINEKALIKTQSFSISRGERPIGKLNVLFEETNGLDQNLVELIAAILAQPLHQWIKSRKVELVGRSNNDFKPHTIIATSRRWAKFFL